MKSRYSEQLAKQREILGELGVPENKLRAKYLAHIKPKFGGKKRKSSNEGKVGRVSRKARRCTVPGAQCLRKKR